MLKTRTCYTLVVNHMMCCMYKEINFSTCMQTIFSSDEVRDKIKQLEQCVSMNEIHDLYKICEYSAVVDKLLPLFDEDPDPPIEV